MADVNKARDELTRCQAVLSKALWRRLYRNILATTFSAWRQLWLGLPDISPRHRMLTTS